MFSRNTESKSSIFLERLVQELPRLVGLGMLDESQAQRIAAFYEREALENPEHPENSTDGRRESKRALLQDRLPAIVISLAVLLIGLGVILFYAANWKAMTPAVKLTQIFVWLAVVFGGAYGCLFHWRLPLLGRGLSLLGMLGFGAAIGLISQIYHISSTPANGVLLWMIGVFALSIVLRDKAGYFLAAALLFLWNSWVSNWDIPELMNANYALIPFTILLGALFYTHERRSPVGLCITLAFALMAAYQIQFAWLFLVLGDVGGTLADRGASEAVIEQVAMAIVLVFVSNLILLGVLLRSLGLLGLRVANRDGDERALALRVPAAMLRVLGWLHVLIPLNILTWPLGITALSNAPLAPAAYPGVLPALLANPPEFARASGFFVCTALIVLAIVATLKYGQRVFNLSILLPALIAGAALLGLVWPLGISSAQLSFGYALLFLVLGIWLVAVLDSHWPHGRVERGTLAIFILITLFTKAVGLLVLGLESDEYLVAYCCGFLLFANVMFLIVRYASVLRPESAHSRVLWLADAGVAFSIYWILYALGFEIEQQDSVWSAAPIVLTLLGLLTGTALLLYILLVRRSGWTLPISLSALVCGSALLALLAGGPWMPPAIYTIVFNVLLMIFAGAVLVYSVRIASVALANLAIAGLVLLILTRYFDLVWDLLNGSALFIVTGLLLLIGGYFMERQRRRLVDSIESQSAANQNPATSNQGGDS